MCENAHTVKEEPSEIYDIDYFIYTYNDENELSVSAVVYFRKCAPILIIDRQIERNKFINRIRNT